MFLLSDTEFDTSARDEIVEPKHFDVREAIMKTCQGKESSKRCQVLPLIFWAERITIPRPNPP